MMHGDDSYGVIPPTTWKPPGYRSIWLCFEMKCIYAAIASVVTVGLFLWFTA